MYIPKRWLAPGILSAVLIVAILVVVLSDLKSSRDDLAAEAAAHQTAQPVVLQQPAPAPAPPQNALCAMSPAELQAFAAFVQGANAPPAPPERSVEVGDFATNSGIIANSQFNDGGFGDIGMQWRDVTNNAPVTNVHTSGNNNTTNVIVGDNNVIGAPQVPDQGGPTQPVATTSTTLPVTSTTVVTTVPPTTAPPATTPTSAP